MEQKMRRRIVALGIVAVVLLNFPVAVDAVVFSTNVRVNDVTSGNQNNASLAVDGNGFIHVVWEDYRPGASAGNVYYAKSTDGGKHFLASVRVTDPAGVSFPQRNPSVIVSPTTGWIHVVWADLRNRGTDRDDRIYYSRSTNGGLTFSPNVPINNGTSQWGEVVKSIRPRVAVDGTADYALYVVWSSFDIVQAANDYGVWYSSSTNNGTTWSSQSKIASHAVDASLSVTSYPLGQVGIGVAYAAGTGQALDIYFISNNGTAWRPAVKVNGVTGFYGAKEPSVAIRTLASPGVFEANVAWTDSRNMDGNQPSTWWDWDIYYSKATQYPPAVFGQNARVNDDLTNVTPRKEQSEPWISLTPNGIPKIAWTDWRYDPQGHRHTTLNNPDIFYSESHDDGATFDTNLKVNSDPIPNKEQTRPMLFEVGSSTGGIPATYIVWQDQREAVPPSLDFNVYFTGYGDPQLQWCGPPSYANSGVNPQDGDRYTSFTYCVRYRSPVGDAPLTGYPRLEIFKGFKSYKGPVIMSPGLWVGSSNDYLAGRLFTYSTNLSLGIDYSYTFGAYDLNNRMAVNLTGTGPVVQSGYRSVDISGKDTTGDQVIAVGWEKNVSLYTRSGGASGPSRRQYMGFEVNYIALSEDGSFLAVAGNEKPYSNTSRGYLRLYGPIASITDPWPLKYHAELNHSILGGDKPLDITRDGSLTVVGTGIVNWPMGYNVGMVRLFQTPATPGTPTNISYYWNRWVLATTFSPDSGGSPGSYYGRIALGAQDGYAPPKHTAGVLTIGSSGGLGLLWENMTDDCPYAVSLDSGGTRLGYGVGWHHRAYLWDMSSGNQLWNVSVLGSTTSAHLTSNAAYFAISTTKDPSGVNASFVLWDSGCSTPSWIYVPTMTSLNTRLDMAVDTEAQYIVGGVADHVYFWGASSGPAPGPTPRTTFTLSSGGAVGSLAMTFHGAYSAVIDDSGRLSVYSSDPMSDYFLWYRMVQ